jgi:DNA-directed RNA polymerase sigma subunit (sigma70/sigma32)
MANSQTLLNNSFTLSILKDVDIEPIPFPGEECSNLEMNNILIGNFLQKQALIIDAIIGLGFPLADFINTCYIKPPKERKVSRDRETAPKNRQGLFRYDHYRYLHLDFTRANAASRYGDYDKLLRSMYEIRKLLRSFDFSLIERIVEATKTNVKRKEAGRYEPLWAKNMMVRIENGELSYRQLLAHYREACRLRDRLIVENEALVYSAREEWLGKIRGQGESMYETDYIQEGLIGLSQGIGKLPFDWLDQDNKLSTVAVLWIKHRIRRFAQNSGATIRVPPCQRRRNSQVREIIKEFESSEGRTPEVYEVAELTGLTVGQVKETIDAIHCLEMGSLNATVHEDSEVGDFIPDFDESGTANCTRERAQQSDEAEMIVSLLQDMPVEQRFVICAQMGLNYLGDSCMDLIEEMLDDSKQRDTQLLRNVSDQRLQVASVNSQRIPCEILVGA